MNSSDSSSITSSSDNLLQFKDSSQSNIEGLVAALYISDRFSQSVVLRNLRGIFLLAAHMKLDRDTCFLSSTNWSLQLFQVFVYYPVNIYNIHRT